MIDLVPIDRVRPSTYNPRKADPRRLDILELSLRKLGFVLPLFADANGELLSGHQRQHVAERIGLTHVPVCFVDGMDLAQRKAINILFNRATNDMSFADTPRSLTDALQRVNLAEMATRVPDAGELYPCMKADAVSVADLTPANEGLWDRYARNAARALSSKKLVMPIVCTPDRRVVNGIGRLQFAAEKNQKTIDVVWVTPEQAELANAMLNLLSMDFDIHNRYEEMLRYNSFRRARRVRKELGQGFVFALLKGASAKTLDIKKPADAAKWKRYYGSAVVDFGAGHLQETEMLRAAGVHVNPFEPYRLGADQEIDKAESLAIANAFLDEVASGQRYDSVFIASVLNSVPFAADRRHIARICAALCHDPKGGKPARLYAASSSVQQTGALANVGQVFLNATNVKQIGFALDYEPNIRLGDFKEKPKVQKYHTLEEFYHLFKEFFETVKVQELTMNATAICVGPKPVDHLELAASLNFEFELPYPDGSAMGLSARAKAAFGQRLGVTL